MRDNINDKMIKELMAESLMNINEPGFTDKIMHKVMLIEKRKTRVQHVLYFLFVMAVSGITIFAILKSIQQQMLVPGGLLSKKPVFDVSNVFQWFSANEYFIIPLIIILMVKGVLDLVSRKTHGYH